MLLKVVLPLLLLVSLHSTLTFADGPDEEEEAAAVVAAIAAAAVAEEMQIPPNCNYSKPNYWARKLHCQNQLPDFTSSNRTFLATITDFTIDHCPSVTITPESFTHIRNLDTLEIDCDAVMVQDGALDLLTGINNVNIRKNVSAFPRHLFCPLHDLHTVNVSNNAVESDAALGLGDCSNHSGPQADPWQQGIRNFDASNNKITALTKNGFLCNLTGLNDLALENNSITAIDKEAWTGVPELLRLYLSGNLIEELSADTFELAHNLYYLNLSSNQLTQLPVFNSVARLRVVDLSNNRIEEVNGTFRNLILRSLHLNGNRLRTIDAHTVEGLKFADELHFQNNAIETIEVDICDYCEHLRILDLSYNRLKKFPKCRAHHGVYELFMDHNDIDQFNASGSNFRDGIQKFSLTHNKLTSIGPKAFAPFHKLTELDLSNNNIQYLDNSAFDGLSELNHLWLHHNKISFQNNVLVFYGKPYEMPVFTGLGQLRTLDLSNNEISELFYSQFPSDTRWLSLNGNKIHTIHPETFKGLNSLQTLNLRNSSLFTLPLLQLPSQYTIIMLEDNPWLCDCEIGWFNNWKKGISSAFDPQSMTCRVSFNPLPEEMEPSAFVQKLNKDFICASFENENRPSKVFPGKCLSEVCQQKQLCPDNCVCYHNFNWRIVKLVCSSDSTMVRVPKKIPSATDVAVFYNVSISSIDEDAFHEYSNVTYLAIRNTRLNSIHENAFKFVLNVETIDLNYNELTILDHPIFKGLFNLKHIDLSYNKLHSINSNVFDDLKQLENLNVEGNRLTNFPVWSIDSLAKMTSLAIGDNPWSCDCTFLKPFKEFLISHGPFITNVSQLYCKRELLSDNFILVSQVQC